MKKTIWLCAILCLAVALVACTPSMQGGTAAPQSTSKTYTIGIAMPHFDAFFFTYESQIAQQVAEANGMATKVVAAEGDISKQLAQIEDFINSGVDAILCVPVDTTAIVSAIDKAKAANVPFVTIGRTPTDITSLTAGLPCDNFSAAKQCAEIISQAAKEQGIEKVKCIEIVGDLKDLNAVERSEGFKSACAELGIEIVAEAPCEWNSEKAYSRLNDAIQAVGGDFNAVYCAADPFLPAVISALQKNNKYFLVGEEGHVIVAGIDGDPLAYEMIRKGEIDGTSNTDAGDFARYGMQAIIDVLNGKTFSDSEKLMPVPSILVNKAVLESSEAENFWGVQAEKAS